MFNPKIFNILFIIGFSSEPCLAKCRAILFSGGANPEVNYTMHLAQLRSFYSNLKAAGCAAEDITVLSASGNRDAQEFNTSIYNFQSPELVKGNYSFIDPQSSLQSGNLKNLNQTLKDISAKSSKGDTVFVAVLNHGSEDGISGWHETINTTDLEKSLSQLPDTVRSKVWTECCFCGQFNSINLKNGCVATSTDANSTGEYLVATPYSVMRDHDGSEVELENRFSKSLRGPNGLRSFEEIARVSQLTEKNISYKRIDDALKNGCMLPARDSYASYLMKVGGIDNSALVCPSFALKQMFDPAEHPGLNCSEGKGQGPLEMRQGIDQVTAALKWLSTSNLNNKLIDTNNKARDLSKAIEDSNDYKNLQKLEKVWAGLSEDRQLVLAAQYQLNSTILVEKINKHFEKDFDLITKVLWPSIVEARFNKAATPEQKRHAEELKSCLSEPLF